MRVAIHQPNFVPWLPFFYKMSMVDTFVILVHCQFEKNGFQNRYQNLNGDWITMPVIKGLDPIHKKLYTNGLPLVDHNLQIIEWIANTLSLNCQIAQDIPTESRGTQRILDILNYYGATTYVTNENSKDKYLDENLITEAGIDIDYCNVPNDLKLPVFEAFNRFGINNIRKRMWKKPKPKAESESNEGS